VKISIGNGDLDILFISEILPKCGDWHAIFTIDFILESTVERPPEGIDYNFSILK